MHSRSFPVTGSSVASKSFLPRMVSKRTTVLKTTTRVRTKTTVSSAPFLPFAAAGKFPQRRGFCGGVRVVSSSSSSSGRGGGGTEGGSGDEEEEEEKDDDSTEKEVKEARKEAETPPPLSESLSRGAAAAGRAPILPGGPRRRRRPDERLKTKEEEEEENKKFEKLQNSLFLSLLVTEGAIKGSAMTALGLLLNVKVIDSFRFLSESASGGDGDVVLLGTGVSSSVGVGIACAMPLVLIDFAIMNLFFPSETSTSSSSSSDASDAPSLRTAVSNYAKEASLNNPCLNMPFYKDAIVASVARVADSFACVFTLGFLFTWITERGIEYGFEVYEIENTTKWLALAATVLGKEAMIFYQSYRRKGFGAGGGADGEKAGGKKEKRAPGMRAYVVTRDKITGKEKMEEITAENIEAKKKRGEKLEPQELAIESAMYNMNVRSTIDNWRERISNGLLGFSFVVSGGNGAAPLVGGLLGDLLFCVYQRNNVKKYLEKYGVDDENNSSSSSSSSRSRSSSSSSSCSSGNKMRTSIAVAKARQREMQSVLVKKMKEKEGETNNTSASESVGTSSGTNSTSSQKINDMIQAVQKEASLVARLVVEADEKESLLSSSSTPARATKPNAERKAFKTLENKLPKLMTGLFDGETPELSEYEVAFKEASNFLRTEKASLESKIQSFDESIEKYRAMFAFIFSNDDVNDEDEDDVREKENECRRETNLEVGKKTKDEGGGTAVEAKEEDDGASFAEKFANFF